MKYIWRRASFFLAGNMSARHASSAVTVYDYVDGEGMRGSFIPVKNME